MPLSPDVKFDNNLPWPRLYSTTLVDRMKMTPDELKAIWDEYTEFWASTKDEAQVAKILKEDIEYAKDYLEDKQGTYR